MNPHSKPGVMQVVDSLDLGGKETVAVNLANRLPQERYRKFLCTTRPGRDGALLASALQQDVQHLALDRRFRFDLSAIARFLRFVRDQNIRILHAHGSSLFFGRLASLLDRSRRISVIWHDHYGRCELETRPSRLYRLAITGASGVIAVNEQLADWACDELHMPREQVWYIPNFVMPSIERAPSQIVELPGSAGNRIVCVANLRPQKDHLTLIRAVAKLRAKRPNVHLLVVGAPIDPEYTRSLHQEVARLGLDCNVSFMGQTEGIGSVLRASDVGVLSSASEGLPLSLLEYGWAGLPSVATCVGQCAEVLDNGKAGLLVNPGSPEQLAAALELLLGSASKRTEFGRRFRRFVASKFDPLAIVNQVCAIYDQVLSRC